MFTLNIKGFFMIRAVRLCNVKGKTFTIREQIKSVVDDQKVPPGRIFTSPKVFAVPYPVG